MGGLVRHATSSKLGHPTDKASLCTHLVSEMRWLTNEENESIMGRGACEWIGWALP